MKDRTDEAHNEYGWTCFHNTTNEVYVARLKGNISYKRVIARKYAVSTDTKTIVRDILQPTNWTV